MLILLLSFSQRTPLHLSVRNGCLEVTRLLVESKADVAARESMYFSPPPSHHLSLTICLAAMATLHSMRPFAAATEPTLLHTCAASARRNDALLFTARMCERRQKMKKMKKMKHAPACCNTGSGNVEVTKHAV
jgi:ankyrin repeat protein